MIEKKISYDINIEKPSKTKPVKQGGVLNYLGKQKTVSAPVKWRSSPKHPIAHLAYITKDEEKILVDLDLYGSLKGKPNKGPSGIMSLNGGGGGGDGGGGDGGGGDGGGSSGGDSSGDSGDSGDAGDSGPGGSDDGSGHGGPGPGVGGDDGGVGQASEGTNDTAADAAAANAAAAAESISADNISTQAQADQEDAETAAAANATTSTTQGVMSTLGTMARQALNAYATFSPVGIAVNAISNAISNAQRGVTGPSDDTQEQSSVQSSAPATSSGGGGITTIQNYAPLTNTSTGDNTSDAIRIRLENLLRVPTSQTVFQNQNVNPLSNYTLLDLYNLRG